MDRPAVCVSLSLSPSLSLAPSLPLDFGDGRGPPPAKHRRNQMKRVGLVRASRAQPPHPARDPRLTGTGEPKQRQAAGGDEGGRVESLWQRFPSRSPVAALWERGRESERRGEGWS